MVIKQNNWILFYIIYFVELDECVAEVQIPKGKHALIIGKEGKNIRRISKQIFKYLLPRI